MKRKPRNIIVFTAFIFLILLGIMLSFIMDTEFWALQNNPFRDSKLNILVVGYDSSINGPPRADTIILASIDLKSKEMGILSIPRDTRVKIPDYGMNRINATHAYGGIELTANTLESYLGVQIDYYLETDFQGFARIIDAIGGVEIEIKEPLNYVDKAGGLYIDLPAGKQVLNGDKSLQYVRYREEVKGDIGRVERQQRFIKAMVKRLLNPDIIIKIPAIYKETRNTVNTNIPLQDAGPFVWLIKDLKLENLETVMLPGQPEYINGASYWIADRPQLDIVINNLIRSKEYIKNSQYQLTVLNGNGETGLATSISDELNKFGFKVSRVGNADHYNYQETLIRYFAEGDQKTASGIQQVLGGRIELTKGSETKQHGAITIIIGKDYLEE